MSLNVLKNVTNHKYSYKDLIINVVLHPVLQRLFTYTGVGIAPYATIPCIKSPITGHAV